MGFMFVRNKQHVGEVVDEDSGVRATLGKPLGYHAPTPFEFFVNILKLGRFSLLLCSAIMFGNQFCINLSNSQFVKTVLFKDFKCKITLGKTVGQVHLKSFS